MRRVVPAWAVLFAVGASAAAQGVVIEMTPDRIREAVADERVKGCYPLKTKGAGLPGARQEFGLGCFTTPYSRVALAAQEARKKYESFTEADVKPELVAPVVEVVALPQQRRFGPGMVNVEAVVIAPVKSKDRAAAIQPLEREPLDSRYQNMLGATFEARGLVARFPLSVLAAGNEVRIVYDGPACSDWKNKPSLECAVPFTLKSVR